MYSELDEDSIKSFKLAAGFSPAVAPGFSVYLLGPQAEGHTYWTRDWRLVLIHRFRFGLFVADDKRSSLLDEHVTIDRKNVIC